MRLQIGSLLNQSLNPELQWIEVASTLQVPSFHIVGLPAPEISEAKERVRAAIEAGGFEFPRRRLVLNLAPASIRKNGTGVDLAMALAIIANSGVDDRNTPLEIKGVASGELGLDGSLRPTGQVTRLMLAALRAHAGFILLPSVEVSRAKEALELIRSAASEFRRSEILIMGAVDLKEAWEKLERLALGRGADEEPAYVPAKRSARNLPDLCRLSPSLERSLCASIAGHHHLLLLGPRGTGKSQALEWLIQLHPDPNESARLTQRLAAELSGLPDSNAVRRVGIHTKPAALVGSVGKSGIVPGEFSRAHGGVLLADEFPEWSRDARESLREPLERGNVTLTRARGAEELPAKFLFVGNGNLCPCGGWPPELPLPKSSDGKRLGFRPKRCSCAEPARMKYLARLAGPVLDRVDMVVAVCSPAETQVKTEDRRAALLEKILDTQRRLRSNWGGLPGDFDGARLETLLIDHPAYADLLDSSKASSLRSRHKILRLALTFAALDGVDAPLPSHFWEAEMNRPENSGWDL